MFDIKRIQQDFSKAAAQYDEYAHLQQHVLRRLVEWAAPLVPADALVLDAGCGTGQCAKLLEGRRFVQLDLSPAMCAIARRNGHSAVTGTIAALPFADGSFDAVISSLALQWLPDWRGAMQELKRVVKPGGVVAVSTFGAATLHELRESFAAIDGDAHVSPFADAQGWQKEIVTEHFADMGALMRALKAIGAANKLAGRRKGLTTRRRLQQVEAVYRERFVDKNGLRVTWEILYWIESCR
ncbi:MAG TPA: methyltransferase domain-containing protein [Rickettsiales bacterium]|nr:methyltransferase domain-containing protein [Rickettsiales bacterium]